MSGEDNPDYVTMLEALPFGSGLYNVIWMRYDERQGQYVPHQISSRCSIVTAQQVRQSWADNHKLEIR